jgi:hypothetical protein
MADQVIASLVGRLAFEINTEGLKQFTTATKQAKEESGRLGAGAVAVGNMISGLAAKAASAAVDLGKNLTTGFAESGAEIDRWSKRLGMSVEGVQRFQAAGRTVGLAPEAAAKSIQMLQKNLGDLQRTGTGPAADALRTLGLSFDQVSKLDTEERINVFADAIARVPDEATRTSVVLQLMGEEAGALVPVLSEGSAGLERLGDKAEALGLVLDKSAIEKAKAAKAALGSVDKTVVGLGNTIAVTLAPHVTKVAERVQAWVEENDELIAQGVERFVEGLVPALERTVEVGGDVVEVVGAIVEGLGGVENALIVAGVAATGFAVAAGGIPAIIAAASIALGLGVVEILEWSGAIEDSAKQIRILKAETRGLEAGAKAAETLREESNNLDQLSDEDYDRLIADGIRGGTISDETIAALDRRRDRQIAERDAAKAVDDLYFMNPDQNVDLILGQRVRAAAKKKGLGEQATQRALGAARQKLIEGGTLDAAEDAATGALDGLSRKPGKSKKVDTEEAELLFGTEFDALGQASGATAKARRAAIEAAAKSLAGGAGQSVARAAGVSQLSSLTGVDLSAQGGPEAALFGQLTKIGGAEAARAATDGARFVNIDQSQTNNITLQIPASYAGALTDPERAAGIAVSLRDILTGEYRKIVDRAQGSMSP